MKRYPFHPSIKMHILIAICFAIWVFLFLYFTEPVEVETFSEKEKWIYLPIYSLAAAFGYLLMLPYQLSAYRTNAKKWLLKNEVIFAFIFSLFTLVFTRLVYIYLVMSDEPSFYDIQEFLIRIFLPNLLVLLPIILVCRWALGKYIEKRIEVQKIEIKGQGNYENLRLLVNDLIFVKSADNYVEINYLEGAEFKTKVMRTKLSNIEKELTELIRTHRSYLINPFHYREWKKETGKLSVILYNDIEIPVSKTYAEELKNVLRFTTKE